MVSTEKSSFRDASARVIINEGDISRIISPSYKSNYDLLMKSGLYDYLIGGRLLIPHNEVAGASDHTVIKPEIVPFISYPYEWSFNILKQAAVTTLKVALAALEHGMMLKDASAYNIQYHKGSWKLIDTTSFEKYEDGMPWYAYGQFIRHFFLPLMLTKYHGGKVLKWLSSNIDGFAPQEYLDLLPFKSYFSLSCLMPLHSNRVIKSKNTDVMMPISQVKSALYYLHGVIQGMKYKNKSAWLGYREASGYVLAKETAVREILDKIGEKLVCDIGTNDSYFTYKGVAIDKDHDCVNSIDRLDVLPLVVDICNPTPAIGWGNEERKSFIDRANFDAVLVLAIVHHICIANNVPIAMVAEQMSKLTKKHLVIEYVSPEDENSKKLALGRVFPEYNQNLFEDSFDKYFRVINNIQLTDTRSLYWYEKR